MNTNLFFSIAYRFSLVILMMSHITLIYASPLNNTEPPELTLDDYSWFENQHTIAMAREGLDVIADATRHGLRPSDYHYPTLVSLISTTNPERRTRFSQLLTNALLTLSHDLKVGRWAALRVDPDWHIPQADFDAKAFLSHAIASRHLKNHFDLLAPTSTDYVKLMTTYERYQGYAKEGGWQRIPPTPKLYLGDYHPNISIIQSRLAVEDTFFALTHALKSDLYDPLMEQAVRRFQARNSLKIDGVIGPNTLRVMNIPITSRLSQIAINLERHRWMPRELGQRHIMINLADYRLQAFENGHEKLAMNVVIGKKDRQTPSFFAEMSHMVFNPFWNVPGKLAQLDLLPKQQQDPNYFFQQSIRVLTKISDEKIELDPYKINWQMYDSSQPLPYLFRQDPGKRNSLGQLKFMFKNPWQIYLHDSPSKSLFNHPNRAYSSGCIRVADPVSLAKYSLMGHQAQGSVIERIESERNHGLVLKQPLNIFAAYFTVSFRGNDVLFLPDVYLRDQRMIKNLY